MRTQWIQKRENDTIKTQLYYAKKSIITEEMQYIANIENISAQVVCDEVAKGRLIIPANINHKNLQPMGIGVALRTKINSNIGSSQIIHSIDEEVQKLKTSIKYAWGVTQASRTRRELLHHSLRVFAPPFARCLKAQNGYRLSGRKPYGKLDASLSQRKSIL